MTLYMHNKLFDFNTFTKNCDCVKNVQTDEIENITFTFFVYDRRIYRIGNSQTSFSKTVVGQVHKSRRIASN